jgi:hypothetical protein
MCRYRFLIPIQPLSRFNHDGAPSCKVPGNTGTGCRCRSGIDGFPNVIVKKEVIIICS